MENLKRFVPYFLIVNLTFTCLSCENRVSENNTSNNENVKSAYDTAYAASDSSEIVSDNKSFSSLDTTNNYKLCTELVPPPPPVFANKGIDYTVDTVTVRRDASGIDTLLNVTILGSTLSASRIYMATLSDQFRWRTGRLKVEFLDGDVLLHNRIEAAAKEWERYCGIRFDFGNHQYPDITISFRYKGCFSAIGTYSLQNTPSMNFGWINRYTDEKELRRVVLHEFGHALGCIHEHQSPSSPIKWDVSKVLQFYKSPPNGWTVKEIEENIFKKYSKNQIDGTIFDPKSIMIYPIPNEITADDFEVKMNDELSETDKQHIARMYPNT